MAVPKKELGSKLSYQEVNEMLTLYASGSEPTDPLPYEGQIWLDTSVTPLQLKRYNGAGWNTIGDLTAADILNAVKTVDGPGSGLDADKLDGQEGSYYRNASNLNAGTVPSDRLSANDLLTLIKGVDGSGCGLDADKLDGIEGASLIRSDAADNVSAHTEWQDNCEVRLGTGADLRIFHNGSASYIDNINGQLNIRQLHHGQNIVLKAENASGTMQELVTLDPDVVKVESCGAFISEMYYETISANSVFVTGIPEGTTGIAIARDESGKRGGIFSLGLGSDTHVNVIHHDGVVPTRFSITKDSGSKINIYYENGFVNIQNGFPTVSRNVRFGFFGIGI